MKPETLIYDKLKKVIPEKNEKTILFAGITNTSNEVYYYTLIDGRYQQCFALAEEYELDENELSETFENIVKIIKDSVLYMADKYNVATVVFDKSDIKLELEYFDINVSEYKVQKEWKNKWIYNK